MSLSAIPASRNRPWQQKGITYVEKTKLSDFNRIIFLPNPENRTKCVKARPRSMGAFFSIIRLRSTA